MANTKIDLVYARKRICVSVLFLFLLFGFLLSGCGKEQGSLADGTYSVQVTLSGGSGRASITSPAQVDVTDGVATARVEWSSPNYDYMIVDGTKYLPVNTEGNSVFEIPVAAFDTELPIIADTTAMSQPHEIAYTLCFQNPGTADNDKTENSIAADKETQNDTTGENTGEIANQSAEETADKSTDKAVGKTDTKDNLVRNKDGGLSAAEISKELVYTGELPLSYATQFAVAEYEDGYRLITVHETNRYLFVPEGEPVPTDLSDDIVALQQPLTNIYVAATAVMDPLASLDDSLSAVGFSSLKADDWDIEAASLAMKDGRIAYAGKYSAPDYEQLLAEDCGLAIENTMIFHAPEIKERLTEFGIPVLIDYSSYESHPLGRMEWVKLYGVLLSKEERAQELFEEAEGILQEVLDAQDSAREKSTVAFFYITTNGAVNVRMVNDYVPKMIALAGAVYVPQSAQADEESVRSSMNMQMEEFYSQVSDADYLIYNSTIDGELSSIQELCTKNGMLSSFRAVQEGNVFCTTSDFYQKSMSVAVFIEDVYEMLHGGDEMQFLYPLK